MKDFCRKAAGFALAMGLVFAGTDAALAKPGWKDHDGWVPPGHRGGAYVPYAGVVAPLYVYPRAPSIIVAPPPAVVPVVPVQPVPVVPVYPAPSLTVVVPLKIN